MLQSFPAWLEKHLEPYSRIRRNGLDLKSLAAEHGSPALLEGMRQLGLVILRPDSLVNRQAASLLDHLQDSHEIAPLSIKVQWVRPYLFDALYRFKAHFFSESMWLHHKLFAQAPTAAVLVAGSPGEFDNLCQRLDHLKGSSSAVQPGSEHQLRSRFCRSSSFHAVMHCAEDPGACLYESTLFFPWSTLGWALGVVATQPQVSFSSVSIPREYQHSLLACTSPGSTVFETLFQVKQRIVASLLVQRRGSTIESLLGLWQLMSQKADILSQASYLAQRDIFIEYAQAERPLLQAAISAAEHDLNANLAQCLRASSPMSVYAERWRLSSEAYGPLHMLYANWFLSGHDSYNRDDGRLLFEVLADNNVPLSPWEQTLVQSGLQSDVNRDARWGDVELFPLGGRCQ